MRESKQEKDIKRKSGRQRNKRGYKKRMRLIKKVREGAKRKRIQEKEK